MPRPSLSKMLGRERWRPVEGVRPGGKCDGRPRRPNRRKGKSAQSRSFPILLVEARHERHKVAEAPESVNLSHICSLSLGQRKQQGSHEVSGSDRETRYSEQSSTRALADAGVCRRGVRACMSGWVERAAPEGLMSSVVLPK